MTLQNMNDLKNHTTDKKNQHKYCQERRRHHKTQQRVVRSETCQTNTVFCSFFYNFINLFIWGCAESLLLHGLFLQLQQTGLLQLRGAGFPLLWLLLFQSREHRLQGARALGSTGSSKHCLQGARASAVAAPGLQSTGSIVVAHGLICMWDRPRSGIKPMSPELAGRFFTTEPPGKPNKYY